MPKDNSTKLSSLATQLQTLVNAPSSPRASIKSVLSEIHAAPVPNQTLKASKKLPNLISYLGKGDHEYGKPMPS